MGKRKRRLDVIERRWRAQFGEPPSLLTDPDLMEEILDADELRHAVDRSASAHGEESLV